MSEEFPNVTPAEPEGPGSHASGQQPGPQPGGQSFGQQPGGQSFGQQPGGSQQGPQPGQQFGQQPGQQYYGQQVPQPAGPRPGQQYGQPGQAGGFPGYSPPVQSVPAGGGPQGYGPRGPSDDHMWALFAYLSPIIVSFLGPLIIYLVKMNESRFVRYHAAQSLNLLITATIYGIGILVFSFILAAVTHGVGAVFLVLYFVLWIVTLVYLILACIGANRGELYQIPGWLCLKIVH